MLHDEVGHAVGGSRRRRRAARCSRARAAARPAARRNRSSISERSALRRRSLSASRCLEDAVVARDLVDDAHARRRRSAPSTRQRSIRCPTHGSAGRSEEVARAGLELEERRDLGGRSAASPPQRSSSAASRTSASSSASRSTGSPDSGQRDLGPGVEALPPRGRRRAWRCRASRRGGPARAASPSPRSRGSASATRSGVLLADEPGTPRDERGRLQRVARPLATQLNFARGPAALRKRSERFAPPRRRPRSSSARRRATSLPRSLPAIGASLRRRAARGAPPVTCPSGTPSRGGAARSRVRSACAGATSDSARRATSPWNRSRRSASRRRTRRRQRASARADRSRGRRGGAPCGRRGSRCRRGCGRPSGSPPSGRCAA